MPASPWVLPDSRVIAEAQRQLQRMALADAPDALRQQASSNACQAAIQRRACDKTDSLSTHRQACAPHPANPAKCLMRQQFLRWLRHLRGLARSLR